MTPSHLDENGEVCTEHPANLEALLTFATIGARMSSFNHDLASKLQGMMMALDEIDELLQRAGDPNLRRAAQTAQLSLKEASALLVANRALTRTGTRSRTALRDLVQAATGRMGIALRGALPDAELEATVPLLAHALGLALDALAGTGRGRALDVAASLDGARAQLVFTSPAEPTKVLGDALALASFVIGREGGELRCGRDRRLHVRLALAAPP